MAPIMSDLILAPTQSEFLPQLDVIAVYLPIQIELIVELNVKHI